jgi:hypothetical protein
MQQQLKMLILLEVKYKFSIYKKWDEQFDNDITVHGVNCYCIIDRHRLHATGPALFKPMRDSLRVWVSTNERCEHANRRCFSPFCSETPLAVSFLRRNSLHSRRSESLKKKDKKRDNDLF